MDTLTSVCEGLMFLAASILIVLSVELRMRAGDAPPAAAGSPAPLRGQRLDDGAAALLALAGWLAPASVAPAVFPLGMLAMGWLARRTLARYRRAVSGWSSADRG